MLARILQVPSSRQGSDSDTQEECVFLGILRPAFTSPATGGSLQWKDVVGLAEIQDARAHGTTEGRKERLREAHHWTTRPPASGSRDHYSCRSEKDSEMFLERDTVSPVELTDFKTHLPRSQQHSS